MTGVEDSIIQIEQETETLFVAVGIAMFGGIVNWLRQKGPRKLSRLVVVVCTAAFAGLVAYYVTSAMSFSSQYQCAFSGIAGYGGGTLLDEAVNRIKEIIHNNNGDKKDNR